MAMRNSMTWYMPFPATVDEKQMLGRQMSLTFICRSKCFVVTN